MSVYGFDRAMRTVGAQKAPTVRSRIYQGIDSYLAQSALPHRTVGNFPGTCCAGCQKRSVVAHQQKRTRIRGECALKRLNRV